MAVRSLDQSVALTPAKLPASPKLDSIPHWVKAILGAIVSVLVTILYLNLEPGGITICLTVGIATFLLILILNPELRYFRAFSAVLGFWLSTTSIPLAKGYIDLPNLKGIWSAEPPPTSFHIACVVLMCVLLVMDFMQRRTMSPGVPH